MVRGIGFFHRSFLIDVASNSSLYIDSTWSQVTHCATWCICFAIILQYRHNVTDVVNFIIDKFRYQAQRKGWQVSYSTPGNTLKYNSM